MYFVLILHQEMTSYLDDYTYCLLAMYKRVRAREEDNEKWHQCLYKNGQNIFCDDHLRIWQGNCYDTLSKLANKPEESRKYRLVVASPSYYNHIHSSKDPREIGQNKPRDYL